MLRAQQSIRHRRAPAAPRPLPGGRWMPDATNTTNATNTIQEAQPCRRKADMPKLLVVDDAALMRKFFRDLFAEDGTCVVDSARNGRDALEQLQRFEGDVTASAVSVSAMGDLTKQHTASPLMHATQANALGDPPGVIVIGVSTGGPRALEKVLPALPGDLAWPVVVVQHMPAMFTGPFAARLDKLCRLRVQEVTSTTQLLPGNVYVAGGGADAILNRRGGRICMAPRAEDPLQFWHPSVQLMMESAMRILPADQLIGVMLTGMGNDGADAMTTLKQQGGRTVAESKTSAVVFGMPGELVRRGGATRIADINDVAGILTRWLKCAD